MSRRVGVGDHRDGYASPHLFLAFFSTFMASARERSPAGTGTDPKRLKTAHGSPSDTPSSPTAAATAIAPSLIDINTDSGLVSQFVNEIFNHNYIAKLHTDYLDSNPFKHAVVEKLFQHELLVKVKDECLRLNFTQKETDIFKVCFFHVENGFHPWYFRYRSSRQVIWPH